MCSGVDTFLLYLCGTENRVAFRSGGGGLSGRGAVLPRGPPLYQWDFIFFVLRPLVQTLAHYVRMPMYGDTLVEAGKVHSDWVGGA